MITHKDIFGWFDKKAEEFYSMVVDKYPDESRFVEIGAYMGQSTCFMAQRIKQMNKKIRFDVIDHFKGSVEHQVQLRGKNLYHIFIDNMINAEVIKDINVFVEDHNKVARMYDDNSIDFVFIDAAHDYDSVKNDIQTWFPKVKSGGIISGDDYVHVHPGVIKAVDELPYRQEMNFIYRNWYYVKP